MSIFDRLNNAVMRTFGEKPDGETLAIEWLDASGPATGIYDSRHYEVEAEAGEGVSTLVTSLAVLSSQMGDVTVGKHCTVRGVTYRVKDMRPLGEGMTVLELERDPDEEES